MTDIKKYVSNGSKILTDEYVEMMWGQLEKSPLDHGEFLKDLEISNKEQKRLIKESRNKLT
jgi:hypothetical protein